MPKASINVDFPTPGTPVKPILIESLFSLSFDKRRSKFFTKELITILQLIETKKIDHDILYGSWAGAFGYFQFMPSTINKYAIDYDNNNIIELKSTKDSIFLFSRSESVKADTACDMS